MDTIRTFVLAMTIGVLIGAPLDVHAQGLCSYGAGGSNWRCEDYECVGYCDCLTWDEYASCWSGTCHMYSGWVIDGPGCNYTCGEWTSWVCIGF